MAFTILDNDESLAADPQSLWMQTDIDAIVAGCDATYVISGVLVTAQGTPDMTVHVAAGTVMIDGLRVSVSADDVTITTASGSFARVDLIWADTGGAVGVTDGTAAVFPKAPALPANSILLAMVLVPQSASSIASDQITDKRLINAGPKTVSQGTLTTSRPALQIDTTWNEGSTVFSGVEINVTATAAAVASTPFKITRDGGNLMSFNLQRTEPNPTIIFGTGTDATAREYTIAGASGTSPDQIVIRSGGSTVAGGTGRFTEIFGGDALGANGNGGNGAVAGGSGLGAGKKGGDATLQGGAASSSATGGLASVAGGPTISGGTAGDALISSGAVVISGTQGSVRLAIGGTEMWKVSGPVPTGGHSGDLIAVTDGGVNIGGSAGNAPDKIYAKTNLIAGRAGTTGTLKLLGTSSGTATITPQAAAGTPTITLPNASGTVAVSASAPLALDTTSGALTCVPTDTTLAIPGSNLTAVGPQTSAFQAGGTITAGDLVILNSSSQWVATDANSAATYDGLLAISLESKTAGQTMKVALPGTIVRNDAWNWTPGNTLYMSETASAITATQPTTTDAAIRAIGYAVTADDLYFHPSPTWITHT